MIKLVKTCGGFPEQYDAFLNGEQVGYLRLRYGHFYAQVPDCGEGPIVYTASPNGYGAFDDDERDYYLRHACQAILDHLTGKERYMPELNYEIQE